jgi:hypothetical protein
MIERRVPIELFGATHAQYWIISGTVSQVLGKGKEEKD